MDESARRLDQFLIRARKLWGSETIDDHGLYAERMSFTGVPLIPPLRRMMAQARQIYVFCDAAHDTAERGEGEAALGVLEQVLRLYSEDGDLARGLAFAIAPDGGVRDSRRDAYTHAFALFALAAAYRLDGDARYLRRAEMLDGFISSRLTDSEHGGLWNSYPVTEPAKFQNPLMHLFEAYLFLHRAAPEGPYLDRAGVLARLFRAKILDREGVLPERLNRDWTITEPGDLAFEPGHHFEWIWLLDTYDEMSGEDHSSVRQALWSTALAAGLNEHRRCMDVIGFDLVPKKASIRLWPHTEGLKAACSMARAAPEESEQLRKDMLDALHDVFLDRPFAGGWIDHLHDGRPLVDYVPSTSLYHLHLANATLKAGRGIQQ